MALKQGTLRVLLNPYRQVDSEGRPCCVVHIDPNDPRYPKDSRGWRGYVGAKVIEAKLIREGDEARGGLRADKHDIAWAFESGVIEVPDTLYYKRIVADGDLIAADAKTAAVCRVKLTDAAEVRLETQLANDAQDAVWLETDGD